MEIGSKRWTLRKKNKNTRIDIDRIEEGHSKEKNKNRDIENRKDRRF
jgi:hypothetical protein